MESKHSKRLLCLGLLSLFIFGACINASAQGRGRGGGGGGDQPAIRAWVVAEQAGLTED